MSGQLNQQQFQTSNATQAKQKSTKPNLGKRKVKKATNSYTDDNSRRLSLDQSNKAFEIADADQQLSVAHQDQNLTPLVI